MKWVTRARPVIDRIACPWLIARFIDKQPEFLFVPPDQVSQVAAETGASPYDVPGVELTHVGEGCSFDTISTVIPPSSRLHLSFAALTPTGMTSRRNRLDSWPSPWVCEILARTITRC